MHLQMNTRCILYKIFKKSFQITDITFIQPTILMNHAPYTQLCSDHAKKSSIN